VRPSYIARFVKPVYTLARYITKSYTQGDLQEW